MQLFGEAGQWASLVDTSKLPAPHSSELCNSIWTEYKSGSQPSAEILMKDLAIWLGKQAGVTLTCAAKLEEYGAHALAKTAHCSAFWLGKCLHEMARTKDHLDCQTQQLVESTRLDSGLLVIAPTNQLSADKHGCWFQHISNSNSTSVKHLLLLLSPTASSQPTLPCSIHHPSSIICHQWQLPISSLLNYHCLDFPDIQ